MGTITVIDGEVRTVTGRVDPVTGIVSVPVDRLPEALGWALKPTGLCRDDRCVVVPDPGGLLVDGDVDLVAAARALGRLAVADADLGVVAVSMPRELRNRTLVGLRAPDLELADLDGIPRRLDDWAGRKRLLVVFATWCGCRHDLPAWQALADELGAAGLTVVAVALDRTAADVRPFVEGISLPVLVDPGHLVSELFAMSNVPSVVWIDEDGIIVRPTGVAHGSDLFAEFTGIEAGPHLDQLRSWVTTGELPLSEDEARAAVHDLSDDEVEARLHFRVADEAALRGDAEGARRHAARASALAPDDLTVWRAVMPLVGEDPFSQAFLDRYEAWRDRGSPVHGLGPVAADRG